MSPRKAAEARGKHHSTRLLLPTLAPFYSAFEPLCYLVLRIAFGLTMVTHGLPKLMGSAHGTIADPMAASTNLIQNVLGLPFAAHLAWLVMALETLGGLAIAVGFAVRLFAPAFAIQMAAICLALWPAYPWIDRGIEYPLLLGFLCPFFAMRGAGRHSLDAWLGKEL